MVNNPKDKETSTTKVETKEEKQLKIAKGVVTPKVYRDGPITYRSCTDFFCIILFLLFWTGLVAIGYHAYTKGDPEPFSYPFDESGAQCGVGDAVNYPKLYFIRTGRNFSVSSTVCIKECPNNETEYLNCQPHFDKNTCKGLQLYATTILNNKFCLPKSGSYADALNNISALEFGFVFEAMSDLQLTWWTNIGVGAAAIVLSYLYVLLLKKYSGLLVWGLVVSFIMLLMIFGLVCLDNAQGTVDLEEITPADIAELDPQYLTAIAYGCFALAFLGFVAVCCYRVKIRLSIAILQASSDFIDDHKGLLLLPLLFFISTVAFYVGWLKVLIHVIGLNTIGQNDDNTPGGETEWAIRNLAMLAYYLFAMLWNHTFGVALMQFIVASTACFWYFKKADSNLGSNGVCKGISRAFLHMGSIIFGSAACGIFGWTRAIGRSFDNNDPEKDEYNQDDCCRSLKYLTRHAFIQLAMRGDGFCKCSKEAFYLLLRSKDRFGGIYGLAWFFLTIGNIFISVCATFVGYMWITKDKGYANNLYSPVAPSIFYFLMSWTISRIFMCIYGTSSDTIIHCFAMDEEMNEGFSEHAPKRLRDFVDDGLHKKLLINIDG